VARMEHNNGEKYSLQASQIGAAASQAENRTSQRGR
jgi:hypothetical protein